MSADDSAAMMLPEFQPELIDGISIYQKNSQLSDKVNRGDYLVELIETVTYIFEREGHYYLSVLTYYWWNTQKQSLKSIVLPEHKLVVGLGDVDLNYVGEPSAIEENNLTTIRAYYREIGGVIILLNRMTLLCMFVIRV